MPVLPEAWEGTEGFTTSCDVTTTSDTIFRFDDGYMDGAAMILDIHFKPNDGGEEGGFFLSTGSGWGPKQKGAIAVQESTGEANPKGFSRQSAIMKFLTVMAKGDTEGVLLARHEAGLRPWDAAFWQNLDVHLEHGAIENGELVIGAKPVNPISGEEKKYSDPFFVTVNAEADGGGKAKAAPKKAAGKAAAPKAETNGDAEEIPKGVLMKLKALAKKAEDHDGFMEAAMEADLADGIEDKVSDEAFYESLL